MVLFVSSSAVECRITGVTFIAWPSGKVADDPMVPLYVPDA